MDSLSTKVKEILQASLEFERLNDWYDIGPVQRATLESFSSWVATDVIKEFQVQLYKHGIDQSNNPEFCKAVIKVKEHFGIKE